MVAGLFVVTPAAAVSVAPAYTIVSTIDLPRALDPVADIRAATDTSVFVAAGKKGTWEVFLDGETPPRLVVPGYGEPGGFRVHSLLAASPRSLLISASFASLTWLDRASGRLAPPFPIEAVVDVDLAAGHVALLGARRDDEGRYSPDGAIAWIGSLERDLADLKPILFSRTGPGSDAMNLCHFLNLGRVRYLGDGNLMVIPGVEGGGYLYSPEGRLLRTWESSNLDLEDGCGLGQEQGFRLAAKWRLRYSTWLNQHRVLDELVPLPEGPGLIIRTREGDTTRWHLRVLRADGATKDFELPISSPSPYAHVRADRLGDRLAVLLKEFHDVDAKSSFQQRILVLEARP